MASIGSGVALSSAGRSVPASVGLAAVAGVLTGLLFVALSVKSAVLAVSRSLSSRVADLPEWPVYLAKITLVGLRQAKQQRQARSPA
jgi:hypothetical protein